MDVESLHSHLRALKLTKEQIDGEISKTQEKIKALKNTSPSSNSTPSSSSSSFIWYPSPSPLPRDVSAVNPYSRLFALEKMGVLDSYESIRHRSVAIVGVGGVGSVSSEMFVRCGIGRLVLIDFDTVEMANLNRMFYRPIHVGMKKVDAAISSLREINGDVRIDGAAIDVTKKDHYGEFVEMMRKGGAEGRPIDIVLCCVDNYEARLAVNRFCNDHSQLWLESGVSEDGLSGHIHFIVPGRTACFSCCRPLIMEEDGKESTLKREGVCVASLPTTMSLIASLLVQESLKYLLGFGRRVFYCGYDGRTENFPQWAMNPNEECSDPNCRRNQREVKERGLKGVEEEEDEKEEKRRRLKEQKIVHTDNEWGIEVVEKCSGMERNDKVKQKAVKEYGEGGEEQQQSLEDLMKGLESIQRG